MHGSKYFFLRSGIKVNKHVAATNKIHARERWVAQNIMRCKHAHFAYFFYNTIVVACFGKKAVCILFRNCFYVALRILANACILYGLFAKVGSKNLYRYFFYFFIL